MWPNRVSGHSGSSIAQVNTLCTFTERASTTLPLPTAIPLKKYFHIPKAEKKVLIAVLVTDLVASTK
jgi:hypothetical protein